MSVERRSKNLLMAFIAYLKEHDKCICYNDDGRRKRHDSATKGHYPIAEEAEERNVDAFLLLAGLG